MKGNSRVIMVDGKTSGWYDKAIFILADGSTREIPGDIVAQAESIVESYLQKELRGESSKSSHDYKAVQPRLVKPRPPKTMNMLRVLALVSGVLCMASILSHVF